MVAKTYDHIAHGKKGLVQLPIKCCEKELVKVAHIDRNETSTIIQLLETEAVQNQDATCSPSYHRGSWEDT